ncbi:MAG: 4'-phosphopantetheinyl transferase superfamily protein [Bacteroidota bacterium]
MLHIYFSRTHLRMKSDQFEALLSLLSPAQQDRIRRYLRWEDAQNGLFGKLLLREALRDLAFDPQLIHQLSYSEYQRPYVANQAFDFNISHTQGLVALVISKQGKVGIDVEWRKEITDLKAFKRVYTDREWDTIRLASNISTTFYQFWTRKEAAMKVIGKGFYLPAHELDVHEPILTHEGIQYHMQPIELHPEYTAHVAADRVFAIQSLKEINYYTSSLPQ